MKNLKQLSVSMKSLLAIGGISVLIGGGVMAVNAMESSSQIDASRAKEIALKDAGVETKQVQFEKSVLEKENGKSVYEVKFRTSDHMYDYTIASVNGDILGREVEALKNTSSSQASSGSLTLEEAKKKALKDSGLKEGDVTFTKTASKKDNGKTVFEIEFRTAQKEYDYDLQADNGAVLEKSVENLKTSNKKTQSFGNTGNSGSGKNDANKTTQSTKKADKSTAASKLLSKTEAGNKALADAGVNASAVTFTKIKLEYEDGRQVYDITFLTSTMEYEYEIDAQSGAIRERKSEQLEIQDQNASNPSGSYIGVDSAKNTALRHAGMSAGNVTFTKAKLENDDGMAVYEIEFRKGNTEYDYTIDAFKGTILEWDRDVDYD